MTNESSIALIAAVALFGMGVFSILGAYEGRIAFDNQPDGMAAQLYASDVGTNAPKQAVLAANIATPGDHTAR